MIEAAAARLAPASHDDLDRLLVFTVQCAGATWGVPIKSVQTIFRIEALTPVPLAPPEIVGLTNLRGKIVTAVSFRRILGLADEGAYSDALAICIDRPDEQFALIVDAIGEVVGVSEDMRIADPPNQARRRKRATARGLYRLEDSILPVLDVDVLFDATNWTRGKKPSRGEIME